MYARWSYFFRNPTFLLIKIAMEGNWVQNKIPTCGNSALVVWYSFLNMYQIFTDLLTLKAAVLGLRNIFWTKLENSVIVSGRPPGFVMQCERPLWYFGLYCVPNNNSCHGTSRKSWSISAPFRESKTFSSCFSNQKYTVYSQCSGLSFWLFLHR